MYALRRWWDRNGIRLGLIGLALGGAWLIRQTQGAFVFEMYRLLSSPFTRGEPQPEQLSPTATARLTELEQQVLELQSQNQQLQQLLGYVKKQGSKGIVAPVIGRSADHWWQQITLGRGSRDGVKVGDIVSGNGGVVGRITDVTPNTSRVLLISDPTSQVGVVVSRSRFMGYIRGQSANRVVMEFFDKVPDVRPGDTVSTSSYSRLFPSGLPVGTVESINLNKSPAPEAVIELSAPISHLEWVVVSDNPQAEAAQAEPTPQPSISPQSRSTPDPQSQSIQSTPANIPPGWIQPEPIEAEVIPAAPVEDVAAPPELQKEFPSPTAAPKPSPTTSIQPPPDIDPSQIIIPPPTEAAAPIAPPISEPEEVAPPPPEPAGEAAPFELLPAAPPAPIAPDLPLPTEPAVGGATP